MLLRHRTPFFPLSPIYSLWLGSNTCSLHGVEFSACREVETGLKRRGSDSEQGEKCQRRRQRGDSVSAAFDSHRRSINLRRGCMLLFVFLTVSELAEYFRRQRCCCCCCFSYFSLWRALETGVGVKTSLPSHRRTVKYCKSVPSR